MPGECALLLLTGYTGLAIQEAATLSRSSGKGSLATLRRAKSGDLVLVATPKPATEALAVTASSGPRAFLRDRPAEAIHDGQALEDPAGPRRGRHRRLGLPAL